MDDIVDENFPLYTLVISDINIYLHWRDSLSHHAPWYFRENLTSLLATNVFHQQPQRWPNIPCTGLVSGQEYYIHSEKIIIKNEIWKNDMIALALNYVSL